MTLPGLPIGWGWDTPPYSPLLPSRQRCLDLGAASFLTPPITHEFTALRLSVDNLQLLFLFLSLLRFLFTDL